MIVRSFSLDFELSNDLTLIFWYNFPKDSKIWLRNLYLMVVLNYLNIGKSENIIIF